MEMEIIYQDEDIMVVTKPEKLFTHASPFNRTEEDLKTILEQKFLLELFPIQRLDRATSGLVVFAKNKLGASLYGELIRTGNFEKYYVAMVRGRIEDPVEIKKPLHDLEDGIEKKNSEPRECLTLIKPLTHFELNIKDHSFAKPYKYDSIRITLVECKPITGRQHQIRRHLKHIRHPIIGDTYYGDTFCNKYFKEILGIQRLMLHSYRLIINRFGENLLDFQIPYPKEFDHFKTSTFSSDILIYCNSPLTSRIKKLD